MDRPSFRSDTVLVVGGGLAGVSACNTVLENGGKVILLDKSAFCGGNSTKATSGINGAGTRTQRDLKIDDTADIFVSDTTKGGAKRPELVDVLCKNSGADVNWLMDKFDLDLSLLARLGGHSKERTHRGKERFPGMTITYALIQMVEKVAEHSSRARILTKAKVTELLITGSTGEKKCGGLLYVKDDTTYCESGPVILASGGFGADFQTDSLLAKHRPDLLHLPTTNGEHCTGDGIKMGVKGGAQTIDLEWVQVHPTGLVNPDDPDAKVKFLAAEALRGEGGLILNAKGERFCNELGRRDYVTGEMWKNAHPPFRLCLNKSASRSIMWHCKHYTGRGVMKRFETGVDLAAEIGCSLDQLKEVHQQHYEAAKKHEEDPAGDNGAQYDAYPSGKSYDVPSGKTGVGKRFFKNFIPGAQVASEEFYVAFITPVIHYCMGGLLIDQHSQVLDTQEAPITGLYAAGEVAGGVHGNNRLGGNSLLDCVVFGRVAGKHAAELILGEKGVLATNLKRICDPSRNFVDVPVRAEGAVQFIAPQAIVVGGGLAGVSACNTVLENGGKVLLLDKSAFCGGNSTKATSGINGAGTKTQKVLKIEDTAEIFIKDTKKGGAQKPELIDVLCKNSGPDVDWLMEKFDLDLSLLARLGGHSQKRTHRGKERFPGMTITYALIQMVEQVAESSDRARIVTKAKATDLILKKDILGDSVPREYAADEERTCIGLRYMDQSGAKIAEYGPVILASGGFGADFTADSLLAKHRPDLLHLPTTNGEHCTGDGIKMGMAIEASTIDLEWVQVHPTGLVNPDDPDAKIKFLAAEALRGEGGLILDAKGERFCNELGRRDYVTGEMWKNPHPPFRLCLNKAASTAIMWHCKHYTGRGVMKRFETGQKLADEMKVDINVLKRVHDQHYEAAMKQKDDPEGQQGKYPAYPDGKSYDEASGKTQVGKKFFHNVIPGSQVPTELFYVAQITPVIHYCMGGLTINKDSLVVDKRNMPINGLYAAGEVAGGVHGNNRLGGNSLLDCVVYGRVAGKHATQWLLGDNKLAVENDLKKLSGSAPKASNSSLCGGSYEDDMNQKAKAAPVAVAAAPVVAAPVAAAPVAPAPAAGGGLTLDEVAKHTTKEDCWVVLNGEVLDVTSFLGSHPGGELAILTFAGKDASEEFNMIHPPDVIGKYAAECVKGPLGSGAAAPAAPAVAAAPTAAAAPAAAPAAGGGGLTMEEVAKHTTKDDCWVALNGQVLDVTSFLGSHPGGELAILTFAGKDASEEFNMIHPPDVIGKYAAECVKGPLGSGGAAPTAAAAVAAAPVASAAAPAKTGSKIDLGNQQAWGKLNKGTNNWRVEGYDENPGVFIINVKSYIYAFLYLWAAILIEVLKTIFSSSNIQIKSSALAKRNGLTRSAILLILFIVIHAVGNLHVFEGPDDFNGYGYFYVRLYWTGFGVPANIVEEYILLSALLHVTVALKNTWDVGFDCKKFKSGKLNLAITGLMLLVFMTVHLLQFRFGATDDYLVRPPPYLIYFAGILQLQLFWTDDTTVQPVKVRDIYKLEFERFLNTESLTGLQIPIWSVIYIFCVLVFAVHASLGWQKVVKRQSFGIPKKHQPRVECIGYIIFGLLAFIYISFPVYIMMVGEVQCGKGMHADGTNLNRMNNTFSSSFSYAHCK